MNTITPRQLHARLEAGETLRLLDVRTAAEHAELHIPGVPLVPLDQLDPAALSGENGAVRSQPLYIVCRSGGRAKQAAAKLEAAGFEQCNVVQGGILAWTEAGLPVHRGASGVISLERQVRIAAGVLVLAGVLLAQFVHPAFGWLAGFVGAGLIFAGITDWCGMGLMLARMPWNQRKDRGGGGG